ncbi:IclR family acetate operon transcriptional repressor [Crossiella equi]|uniref:IclR family acetate operon transcriptional repressor n=1 Tax=Crossiella equi TaxID=130796 RepID=A0ABS5AIK4_9PSEU|nr:helix-turn-helix domain-containing protein [Crossiella equi]MBP2476396.1 IclR family acetate operon transcriptional repressor [Crossiella equi]
MADPRNAVEKTLDLLFALCPHGTQRGVSELARELGLSKTTVHRQLATLCHRRVVEQVDGRYRLGPRAAEFAPPVPPRPEPRPQVRDRLARLAEHTGFTASLGALESGELVVLDQVVGVLAPDPPLRPGFRLVPHNSALGKVLLAVTHTPVADRGLAAELDGVRVQGVASHWGGRWAGVAVPLPGYAGGPYAVSLAGPTPLLRGAPVLDCLLRSTRL